MPQPMHLSVMKKPFGFAFAEPRVKLSRFIGSAPRSKNSISPSSMQNASKI